MTNNMVTHDHEADALPQAAGQGDTRTFGDYLRSQGRVAIASSKSGPAFDTPLAVDLARSLQAQGVAACGDLLSAISRKCWPDIMAAWPRVISTLNLTVSNVPVVLSAVDYDHMLHTVIVAMGSAQDMTAAAKWQHVDTVLRRSAPELAQTWAAEAFDGWGRQKAAEFAAFARGAR